MGKNELDQSLKNSWLENKDLLTIVKMIFLKNYTHLCLSVEVYGRDYALGISSWTLSPPFYELSAVLQHVDAHNLYWLSQDFLKEFLIVPLLFFVCVWLKFYFPLSLWGPLQCWLQSWYLYNFDTAVLIWIWLNGEFSLLL